MEAAAVVSLPASTEPPTDVEATESAPPRVIREVGVAIQSSPAYMEELRDLVLLPGDLKARGYPLEQLSKAELEKKMRCKRCMRGGAITSAFFSPSKLTVQALTKPQRRREPKKPEDGTKSNADDKRAGEIVTATEALTLEESKGPEQDTAEQVPMKCKFHDGRVFRGKWSCCNEHVHSPPCKEEQEHLPRHYARGELASYWKLYKTPPSKPDQPARRAVVLDCEMGVAESGESELIRLSMVDYFTCDLLIDSLIWPDVKMSHYNTRFSGVTRAMMERARRSNECIFGNKKTRLEIWKHVGPRTIIVGHSAQGDLKSLRLIHQKVVDTLEVEKHMSGRVTGLSLKSLAKEKLDREIQVSGKGHDSLEDAIATRDLLHWHVSLAIEQKQTADT